MAWPANTWPGYGLDAGAHDLAEVGRLEGHEGDDGRTSAPMGRRMISGTNRKNHRITITSGMERMPLT